MLNLFNCSTELTVLYELCIQIYGRIMLNFIRPTEGIIRNELEKFEGTGGFESE